LAGQQRHKVCARECTDRDVCSLQVESDHHGRQIQSAAPDSDWPGEHRRLFVLTQRHERLHHLPQQIQFEPQSPVRRPQKQITYFGHYLFRPQLAHQRVARPRVLHVPLLTRKRID